MKKIIVAVFFAVVSLSVNATDNIFAACKAVKMSCSYTERFDLANRLSTAGKNIIPVSTNPYIHEEGIGWTAYIGRPLQNEILARNITKNKKLFVHGYVPDEDLKKWVQVP